MNGEEADHLYCPNIYCILIITQWEYIGNRWTISEANSAWYGPAADSHCCDQFLGQHPLLCSTDNISLYTNKYKKNTNTNTKLQNTFCTLLSPIPWPAPSALLQPIWVSIHNYKFWKNMNLVTENTWKAEFALLWWTVLLSCTLCTVHVCHCIYNVEKRMAGPQGPQRSVANPPICLWILQRSSK